MEVYRICLEQEDQRRWLIPLQPVDVICKLLEAYLDTYTRANTYDLCCIRLIYFVREIIQIESRLPSSTYTYVDQFMMTSSNGNIFRFTDLLCGEFTGARWIPQTKASDAELCCFLWSAPEPTVEQTLETQVIRDAITLMMTSLWCHKNAVRTHRYAQLFCLRQWLRHVMDTLSLLLVLREKNPSTGGF